MSTESPIELSAATPEDVELMAEMSRHLIERGLGWSWRAQRISRNLRRADTLAVVARADLPVVGFGLMRYLDDVAHLLLFAVDPEYQRRGIGTQMLEWLESCARLAGIPQMRLEVLAKNRAGRVFYYSQGFRERRRLPYYYGGKVEGIQMVKELQSPASEALSVERWLQERVEAHRKSR